MHNKRALFSRVIVLVSHFRKHYFDSNALLHTFRTRDLLSPDRLSGSIQNPTLNNYSRYLLERNTIS